MNTIKRLRERLGVTQTALGEAIGCTQGNIGHYEQGQTMPPSVARKFIDFARTKGVVFTFDDIYAPDLVKPRRRKKKLGDLPPIVDPAPAPGWNGVDRRDPLARAVPPGLDRREKTPA